MAWLLLLVGVTVLLLLPSVDGAMYGRFRSDHPSNATLRWINETNAAQQKIVWTTTLGYAGGQLAVEQGSKIYYTYLFNRTAFCAIGIDISDGTTTFKACTTLWSSLDVWIWMVARYQETNIILGLCRDEFFHQECEIGVLNKNSTYETKTTFARDLNMIGSWARVDDRTLFAFSFVPMIALWRIDTTSWQKQAFPKPSSAILNLCFTPTTGLVAMVLYGNSVRLERLSALDGSTMTSVTLHDVNIVGYSVCAIDAKTGIYYTVGMNAARRTQLLGIHIASGTIAVASQFPGPWPTDPFSMAITP